MTIYKDSDDMLFWIMKTLLPAVCKNVDWSQTTRTGDEHMVKTITASDVAFCVLTLYNKFKNWTMYAKMTTDEIPKDYSVDKDVMDFQKKEHNKEGKRLYKNILHCIQQRKYEDHHDPSKGNDPYHFERSFVNYWREEQAKGNALGTRRKSAGGNGVGADSFEPRRDEVDMEFNDDGCGMQVWTAV